VVAGLKPGGGPALGCVGEGGVKGGERGAGDAVGELDGLAGGVGFGEAFALELGDVGGAGKGVIGLKWGRVAVAGGKDGLDSVGDGGGWR